MMLKVKLCPLNSLIKLLFVFLKKSTMHLIRKIYSEIQNKYLRTLWNDFVAVISTTIINIHELKGKKKVSCECETKYMWPLN